MLENFRDFRVGPDPFGRTWNIRFLWQQTAISIRHSDSVDVKFLANDGGENEEKVIALPHPLLLQLCAKMSQPLTDAWCMKLAALHLQWMIETGEDVEKTLVTMSKDDLERANTALQGAVAAR